MSPSTSKLFTPLVLGEIALKHRVVLAPMTRNRGTPSFLHQNPKTWYPSDLVALYYTQRTTDGGMLISEATPVCPEGSGLAGIPGVFTSEQISGWKRVIDSVHSKGGVFIVQLWHAGRTTHTTATGGTLPLCPSAVPKTGKHKWRTLPDEDYEVPMAMTLDDINKTIMAFVDAAVKLIKEAGADGVELHAANGYLIDQFLHSNINQRTDAYGGSAENRCRFLFELVEAVGNAVGYGRVGVKLSPFGLFHQTRGKDRIYQWTYICQQLAKLKVAYVHLVEPRFDFLHTEQDKLDILTQSDNSGSKIAPDQLTLKAFREALRDGDVACIVTGGYNERNCWDGIEKGDYDAIAFGRYFTSNEDLVQSLKDGRIFLPYDRSTFYGPFDDSAIGYTVFQHPPISNLSKY